MALDAVTQAALEEDVTPWRVLVYADFQGDVLRATSGLYERNVTGSGDAELDGLYDPYDHNLVSVGAVTHQEDGSDTVTIALSGLIVNDADFLNLIGDRTRWQGRAARLWFYLVDEDENPATPIIPYYTGYMTDVTILGDPKSQTVALTIENYLASLSGAQAKTYLMQDRFDPGDTSAAASIAAANGLVEGTISGGASGGAGQGGGDGNFPKINLF
ncbi:MAG: hypothetical protein AAFP79_04945 [Pseudomonadota bacterium]